jgi:hypothetical protein
MLPFHYNAAQEFQREHERQMEPIVRRSARAGRGAGPIRIARRLVRLVEAVRPQGPRSERRSRGSAPETVAQGVQVAT